MSAPHLRPPPPSHARRKLLAEWWNALATALKMTGLVVMRGWRAIVRWLRVNTFTPPWLPRRWQHPLTGYIVALLVQGLATLLTLLLVFALPGFPFPSVLALVGIVLVGLSFGAGPSLLATGIGAVLVDSVVVPQDHPSWPLVSFANAVALALLVGAGAVVSVVASQTEQARRAAEAATRDREAFLAVAAHELKTPLMVIQGSAQLLTRRLSRSTPTKPTAHERERLLAEARLVVARIQAGAERMGRLVDEMLELAAIQAGRLEYHVVRCDLTAIVREAVEIQRQQQPHRRLILEVSDAPVMVRADPERIAQVVTEYLTNALKYAPEEPPITVRLEIKEGRARVSVHDEGSGLPTDEQERVWEVFYRAPGVEVQSGSHIGLGLGLYLCRAIVERHGGQTGVESAVGQGSTFWFTVPLIPAGGVGVGAGR